MFWKKLPTGFKGEKETLCVLRGRLAKTPNAVMFGLIIICVCQFYCASLLYAVSPFWGVQGKRKRTNFFMGNDVCVCVFDIPIF
mmetsp:Transcript_20483/g.23503  ORF Transcript_20483/g.23503 Transcript_20483/m.23503 type:complete len:84 (-) Transcript_20483:85-336(-)